MKQHTATRGKSSSHVPYPITAIFSWFKSSVGISIVLGIFTFLVFSPAIRFDFIEYDDGVYVFENAAVKGGLGADGFAYAIRSIDGGNWMPLTWLSLMLDTTLFGVTPSGYHFTNLVLHSSAVSLLFLALHRMTQRSWLSATVTVFFSLHPLRTESVVWIAERKDVLSGVFWMLGLLAYARYVRKLETCDVRPRMAVMATVVCLALGLMAKPMLVTFPFILLLLDFWPLNRMGNSFVGIRKFLPSLVKEKIPLFVLAAVLCMITFWAQDKSGAVVHAPTPLPAKISSIACNYAFYIEKTFLPARRTVVYPELNSSYTMQASAICVLVFVVALAIVMMFRWPWLAVGGFWFLGSLAPVIGLVRVGYAPVADRYSYLPSIGLAIAIVWGLGTVARRKPWLGRLSAGVAMIVATTLIIATRVDLRRWKDSGALFEDASRNAPHKISLNNFAFFLIKRGDYTRASDILSQAIELDPNYGVSYGNRTMAKALLGDYEAAKSDYDQAIRRGARPIQPMRLLSPSDMTPNLVAVSQDPEAAWYLYADVARLEPRKPESFLQRASFRAIQGNIAGALADYDKAIQLGDSNPAAYTGRGNTHVLAANWPAALADLTRAIELSPTNAASYQNRAVVFFKMEAFSNAWSDVARCREFGGTPHESFLDALSKASGRHE